MLEAKYKKEKYFTLALSLFIDFIGLLSFIVPGVTWLFDVVWAPVSGLLLFYLYNQSSLALFGFAEEILPFTDLVPTATITWINKYHKKNEQTFEAFAKKEKRRREIIEHNS